VTAGPVLPGPRPPSPIARAVALVVTAVVIALAMNVAYTTWSVTESQKRWCHTLITLDNADQHAPAPTTKFGRQLVTDFHHLRLAYGCGQ
jgi:hypothetical protein